VLSVLPKDLSLGSTYLSLSALCNSIKHPKYVLFVDTNKIARSISYATDSKLPQSDIYSIHGRCGADLVLMKLKSEVQRWLCIVLVNQTVGTHTYCDLLFVCYWLFLIVILHPASPQYKYAYLPVVTLWLLKPVGWNTSKSVAVCFSRFFSSYFLQLYLCTLASKVAYFKIQEESPWPFYFHAFIVHRCLWKFGVGASNTPP